MFVYIVIADEEIETREIGGLGFLLDLAVIHNFLATNLTVYLLKLAVAVNYCHLHIMPS